MTWKNETLRLLRERPHNLTFGKISEDTDLPEPWISKFSQELIKSPSVDRVEILHNYLKGYNDNRKN